MSDNPFQPHFNVSAPGVPGEVLRPERTPEMLEMNYQRICDLRARGVQAISEFQVDGLLAFIALLRA